MRIILVIILSTTLLTTACSSYAAVPTKSKPAGIATSTPKDELHTFEEKVQESYNTIDKNSLGEGLSTILELLKKIGERVTELLHPIARFGFETMALIFETFAKILRYIVNIF